MREEKKEYWENGNLKAKWYEDENGLKRGSNEEYWKNGLIKEHSYYENGKKHGMFLRYNLKGQYIKNGRYENGVEQGDFQLYIDKGTLRGRYENGQLYGELKLTEGRMSDIEIEKKWCENGKQYPLVIEKNENKTKEYYKDEINNYIGIYKEYDSNRKLVKEANYKDGNLEYLVEYKNNKKYSYKEFYQNGNIKEETNYLSYHKKEYWENGELFSEIFDKNINGKDIRLSKKYFENELICFSVDKNKEIDYYVFGMKDGKLDKVIKGTEQIEFKGEEALKQYQFVSKFLGEDFLNLNQEKKQEQEKVTEKESKAVRGRATRGRGGNER